MLVSAMWKKKKFKIYKCVNVWEYYISYCFPMCDFDK